MKQRAGNPFSLESLLSGPSQKKLASPYWHLNPIPISTVTQAHPRPSPYSPAQPPPWPPQATFWIFICPAPGPLHFMFIAHPLLSEEPSFLTPVLWIRTIANLFRGLLNVFGFFSQNYFRNNLLQLLVMTN